MIFYHRGDAYHIHGTKLLRLVFEESGEAFFIEHPNFLAAGRAIDEPTRKQHYWSHGYVKAGPVLDRFMEETSLTLGLDDRIAVWRMTCDVQRFAVIVDRDVGTDFPTSLCFDAEHSHFSDQYVIDVPAVTWNVVKYLYPPIAQFFEILPNMNFATNPKTDLLQIT